MTTKPPSKPDHLEGPPRDARGRWPQGLFGGSLMGMANLVPGISGGTMLLAAGVYPQFIGAVAELSTLRVRWRSLQLLGSVVLGAAVAIAMLAGPVKGLVVEHRWVMYSLFIGLTLGGVPVVWRLLRPMTTGAWIGATFGLVAMIGLAIVESTGAHSASAAADGRPYLLLFIAGLVGGSAMILPGVSGGYLLLLLGQYVTILTAVSSAKDAVVARDMTAMMDTMHVIAPVGLGVVVGVVGVSNGIKLLLDRFPGPTLGMLLGLLVGAVFGLWPFRGLPEAESLIGEVIKGAEMTSIQMVNQVPLEDWPVIGFAPTLGQMIAAAGLVLAGLAMSWCVSRIGGNEN